MIGDGSEIYSFPAYMVHQDPCYRVRMAALMFEVQPAATSAVAAARKTSIT